MRTSIQLKIVLIYLCTIIIIMLISGTYIVYSTEERSYESVQSTIENMAENIEERGNWNLDDLSNQVDDQYEIYCLDSEGRVESTTGGKLSIGERVKEEVVVRAKRTKKSATAEISHFSVFTGSEYTDHARVILNKQGDIERIIYIKANIVDVHNNIFSIMKTITIGLVLAMFITGFCGIVFSNMITSPIKALTNNSKKLAAGNSINRIPVEAADEIGELTQSFNYMASQLSTTMEVITSEKNKLEKIFEHMADGVMAFNRQGVLIHVNSVCYEMIGATSMAPNFEEVFENIGLEVNFEELLAGKPYEGADQMLIIGDRYLKMHFDVYLNAKKEADGLVVVIQDVTKQQKLDQMRKEFVANVSHELRTPLTTVKSYTETLLDGAIDEKETAMHFLGVMEKEADRMTALVQDLLELSRIDNKQIQLEFVRLNLKPLLEEVLEAQYIHIIKQGHQLEVGYDKKEEYFIEGDLSRIRQILHNILSNAIKYSPEPGTLGVYMKKENAYVIVEITDTGMGIPEEDLERIFERFYRVDKARSRKMGGTGLGLSIAKELMLLHGGDIKIESQLGQGTKVILNFPEAVMKML